MEPQTWIKWSGVSKSTKLTEGQLNVPRVCKRFGMDPDTLEIAGREVEWSRNTGYSSNFPDLCQHQLGDGTEDNPIQVDGKPLQGAGTTAAEAAAGGGAGAAGIDSNTAAQILQKLDLATGQLDIWSRLQLQDFRSDDTPSTTRDQFKPAVIKHYYVLPTQPEAEAAAAATSSSTTTASKQSNSITHHHCMVTGVKCNIRDLQAGHILGYKQRHYARLMDFDYMSPQNGLLWLKTLEAAWSNKQCCFARPPSAFEVCFTLLDSTLKTMRLVDYPGGGNLCRDTTRALGEMTFGDLHMKPLLVQPLVGAPLKGAMCFMAHIYRKLARQDGVSMTAEAADDDNFDYWSEFDAKNAVTRWLVKSPI